MGFRNAPIVGEGADAVPNCDASPQLSHRGTSLQRERVEVPSCEEPYGRRAPIVSERET